MNDQKKYINIIFWITAATIFGKALGILRDVLLSYYYGSNEHTDVFFLAMSIPTVFLGVFTASTDSAVIPQYKRISNNNGRIQADSFFSIVINILAVIGIASCILMFVVPELFVSLFAMGFNKQSVNECVFYLRIFSPIGIFTILYCFFCAYNAIYLQNKVRTILAFSTNLIVVCTLIFWHDERFIALSIAYLAGNIICALLPIISAFKLGYRHAFKVNIKDGELVKFISVFFPIMGTAILNNFQEYVDKNLGSYFSGGISSLNYGIKLVSIFDSMIVVGISLILLPKLAELNVNQELEKYKQISTLITLFLFVLLLPVFVFIFSFPRELITLLFGRGEFGESAVQEVSLILMLYSPLIVLHPLQTIFSRFYHAKENTRLPFLINFISVALNTVFSILLMQHIGVLGISLGTTIATVFSVIVYLFLIKKDIGWDKDINLVAVFLEFMAITVLCSVLCRLIGAANLMPILKLLAGGVTICVGFVIAYFVFIPKGIMLRITNLIRRDKK